MSSPIAITGASGLLGRAVVAECTKRDVAVIGLGFTRSAGDLQRLDLTDDAAVARFFAESKPGVVIHCAAERRPDVAERDPEAARVLNVDVPSRLGRLCSENASGLVYVSTDYVFPGNAPSNGYDVDAEPKPLNLYGETKLAGERAALESSSKGSATVLRVPVLYGEAPSNADSAVNILVNGVRNASKPAKMDSWAQRYPTCVEDVARVLVDLALRLVERQKLPPILHFSAQERMTKLDMAHTFARLLNLPTDHIQAVSDEPKPGDTPRPRDCHLSTAALDQLGVDTRAAISFEDWWRAYFARGGGAQV